MLYFPVQGRLKLTQVQPTEWPPLYYADLGDRELIQAIQQTRLSLEERAQAVGGRLLLRGIASEAGRVTRERSAD